MTREVAFGIFRRGKNEVSLFALGSGAAELVAQPLPGRLKVREEIKGQVVDGQQVFRARRQRGKVKMRGKEVVQRRQPEMIDQNFIEFRKVY